MTAEGMLPIAATTMTKAEAEQVTRKIETRLVMIAENTKAVVDLIEQAREGGADRALGYASWPAYVAGRFGDALVGLRRAERVPIVEMLTEQGLSTRAIAGVVGTSFQQVAKDVSPNATPAPITGLDGKRYVRNGRPTEIGMREIAEAVPPVKAKRPVALRGKQAATLGRALDHMRPVVAYVLRLITEIDETMTLAESEQIADELAQARAQISRVIHLLEKHQAAIR